MDMDESVMRGKHRRQAWIGCSWSESRVRGHSVAVIPVNAERETHASLRKPSLFIQPLPPHLSVHT